MTGLDDRHRPEFLIVYTGLRIQCLAIKPGEISDFGVEGKLVFELPIIQRLKSVQVILVDLEKGTAVQIAEDMLPVGWMVSP